MPQLVGLRNGSSSRGQRGKKKPSQHCYFRAYQDLHLAREAIHKLQKEIDALRARPSQGSSTDVNTSQEDDTQLESLSPATALKIISLEMSQDEIRLKIAEKRNQLSSLRVLPVEVFDDILTYAHLHCEVPRLDLALVCRTWHLAILSIPHIWSNISLISAVTNSTKPVEWLNRRLELAKNVTLDITLSATCSPRFDPDDPGCIRRRNGISEKVVKQLHEVVLASGTERWRSLTIVHGIRSVGISAMPQAANMAHWPTQITHLAGGSGNSGFQSWISAKVQGATFSRLRKLDIQNYAHIPQSDVYVELYSAITRTATRLEECFLHKDQIPLGFLKKPGRLFQGLLELKAGSFMLNILTMPKMVRYLDIPCADFPLDFSRVTDLTLKTFSNAGTIYFQALTVLSIAVPSLPLFRDLCAPNLRKLVLGRYRAPSRGPHMSRRPFTEVRLGSQMKNISDFMRNPLNSPSIFPITLQLQEETAVELMCHMLERWVQLQHVSIKLDESKYSFKTELQQLETLLKARDTVNGETGPNAQATWKLCPNLRTLHIDSVFIDSIDPSEFEGDLKYGYEQMARAVAFSRRRGPLERVIWGPKGSGEAFVTSG